MTPLNEAMTQVSFVSCPGVLSFDTSTSLVMPGGNKQGRAGISQNLFLDKKARKVWSLKRGQHLLNLQNAEPCV